MKTKFVYVVASSESDIYLEQVIVSAWSLRYYNPEAHIILVCDQDTRPLLDKGWQKEYATLFNEIKICHYEASQNLMERSRQMKTTLRSIISGDFLFLDSDTLVCADLSFVDDYSCDLGFVFDNNCTFDKFIIRDWVVFMMQQIFNMDVTQEKEYFNSGVFFAKDTELAHTFFAKWHENWCYEKDHSNSMKDQQPLMKTNIDMGHVITEISGIMNCQVVASIRYLPEAAIVHIYNNFIGKDSSVTPFHSLEAYRQIKENGFSDEWRDRAVNFKDSFCSPSFVLGESNALLWRRLNSDNSLNLLETYTGRAIKKIYNTRPRLFRLIEKFFVLIHKL